MIVENEITLAEAIERARNRGVISGGSFEWFRKQAAKSGRVHIAEGTVIAFKRGRRWMVAEPQLEEAIVRAEGHKNAKNESERQAGEDYVARILNPKGARTSWGGYRVHGDFHFVWSDYERMRQRSDGMDLQSVLEGSRHRAQKAGMSYVQRLERVRDGLHP